MHDLPLTAEARPVQASPSASLRAWIARELHWRQLLRLGAVTVQLTLLVAAIRLLNIETRAFEKVLMLALGGFLIHHFLPLPQRLPFFAILSVASVFVVFGLPHGAWLLGLGALLIGLCHLPVSICHIPPRAVHFRSFNAFRMTLRRVRLLSAERGYRGDPCQQIE